MSPKILITGAAGGSQGATGNRLARLLLENGVPVRAFVRKLDERYDVLREMGAEVFAGDLVNIQSVREALEGIEGSISAIRFRPIFWKPRQAWPKRPRKRT